MWNQNELCEIGADLHYTSLFWITKINKTNKKSVKRKCNGRILYAALLRVKIWICKFSVVEILILNKTKFANMLSYALLVPGSVFQMYQVDRTV